MRVAIAGAGAVGRSVAAELLDNGHQVLLIDKDPGAIRVTSVRLSAARSNRVAGVGRDRSTNVLLAMVANVASGLAACLGAASSSPEQAAAASATFPRHCRHQGFRPCARGQ